MEVKTLRNVNLKWARGERNERGLICSCDMMGPEPNYRPQSIYSPDMCTGYMCICAYMPVIFSPVTTPKYFLTELFP